MRRTATATAGLALLLAAVVLALVGHAVLAEPRGPQASLPHRAAAGGGTSHGLAARIATALTGDGGEGSFRRIVTVYEDAAGFLATAGDPKGPIRIAALIPGLRSDLERAQALTMAATLLAYSAGAGFGAALPPGLQKPTDVVLAQAITDLRAAILLEPGDETAKRDLELLLHQLAPPHRTPQPGKTKRPPKGRTTGKTQKGTSGEQHHAGIYEVGSGY